MPLQPAGKVIWVHIGTHRQHDLDQHALAATGSVCAPTVFMCRRPGTTHAHSGHHNLAWQLRDDPRFQPGRGTLDDLLAQLST